MSSIYRNGRLYGGSESHLDGLDDVTITSPAAGDLLQRNGSGKWVNSAVIPQKVTGLRKTGCVNRFNNTAISQVINGTTYTVNADKTVLANGNPTAEATLHMSFPVLPGGTYKLIGCPSNGSSSTYQLAYYYRVNSWTSKIDIGDGNILTIPDNVVENWVGIKILAGTTVNNLLFKPMITDDLSATYADYQPYSMTNRELTTIEDITSEFSYASGIIARTDWTRIIRCGKLISVQMRFTTPSTVTDGIAVMSVPGKYAPKIAKQNNNAMVCGGLMSTTSWNGAILGVLAWYNSNFILMSTGWQTSKECVIQFNYLID